MDESLFQEYADLLNSRSKTSYVNTRDLEDHTETFSENSPLGCCPPEEKERILKDLENNIMMSLIDNMLEEYPLEDRDKIKSIVVDELLFKNSNDL